MRTRLTAGDHTNKFDLIAILKDGLRPFVPVKRRAVVLDQDRLRRQFVTLDQLGDCFGLASIGRFAVKNDFHGFATWLYRR